MVVIGVWPICEKKEEQIIKHLVSRVLSPNLNIGHLPFLHTVPYIAMMTKKKK